LRALPDFRIGQPVVLATAIVTAVLAAGVTNAVLHSAGLAAPTPRLSIMPGVAGQSADGQPPIGTPFETESPSLTLTKPADGRLNGYGFSFRILGFGEAPSFSSAFGGESAPAGETMAVVTYDLQSYEVDGISPDLYFVAGDQRAPLGDGSVDGTWSEAVSVPEHVAVGFAVSEVGLTQEFSFATGAPRGPVPA
jgi:hypothetical protein